MSVYNAREHKQITGYERATSFNKIRKRQLKKIARELEYDVVNPEIFAEIDAATTESEATQIMRRARNAAA